MSQIKRYLIITFLTTWILEFIGIHDRNIGTFAGDTSFSQALALCMFMPSLGALLAGAKIGDMGWRLHPKKNIKPILFAWLAPTVLLIAGAALYFLVFPGDFDLTGVLMKEYDPEAYEKLMLSNTTYPEYVAKHILVSLTSFHLPVAVFLGLGEEIGWRGFLFPELDQRYGRTKAVLIGGVIHGAWHFPLMLFTGYEYGRGYIGAPLLGMIAFCVFTVSTGIISYYLYEKTCSIWLPAIYHGVVNSTFNVYLLFGSEHFERSVFGPADIGLIGVIPTLVLAVCILRAQNRRECMELETETFE